MPYFAMGLLLLIILFFVPEICHLAAEHIRGQVMSGDEGLAL